MELSPPTVLLVHSDPSLADRLLGEFPGAGLAINWVDEEEKAYNYFARQDVPVLLCELSGSRVDGMRLMQFAHGRNSDTAVIFLVAANEVDLATEAMRQGAYDFQIAPLQSGRLVEVVNRALALQRLLLDHMQLRRQLDERFSMQNLLGRSKAIATAYETIRQAAPLDIPVIVVGEAGTGKDLVAHAVHAASARSGKQFVKVTSAPSSPTLFDRELLGHAAGAFADSAESRQGRIELADQGTLYLDNLATLSPVVADQLIETIRTGATRRMGEQRDLPANVRLIVSVVPGLGAGDPTQEFLTRLQHEFSAAIVELPALRERPDDIPILVEHFLRRAASAGGQLIAGIAAGTLDLLARYSWPGNVRELENVVQGMVTGAKPGATLQPADIPVRIRNAAATLATELRIPVGTAMADIERQVILETLKSCGYKKELTAKTLGIGLRTLYRKLKQYDSET